MSKARTLAKAGWILIIALLVSLSALAQSSPVTPGDPIPASTEAGDQKLGSVLVYNFFASDPANAQTETEISLTNTNETATAVVHLFFVDGATGKSTEAFVLLGSAQTASLLASNVAPGVSGFVIAVAVDLKTGCPVSFNFLRGSAFIKLASGHTAKLGAEAMSALYSGSLNSCNAGAVSAQLNFDGAGYNRLSRMISLPNLPSIGSLGGPPTGVKNSTLLVVNQLSGSLVVGLPPIGNLPGVLYDDAENALAFTIPGNSAQVRGILSNTFPRISPTFSAYVPEGRTGWMRLFSSSNVGLVGAAINFSAQAATNSEAFNGGLNLHKLTVNDRDSLEIPVSVPPFNADLTITKTASASSVAPSTTLTYTITVTNRGPLDADSVAVTDVLPKEVTFVSCGATGGGVCGGSGNNRTATFASIKKGDSATITLVVKVAPSVAVNLVIANMVSVSAATTDLDLSNNSATARVTVLLPIARITPGALDFPKVPATADPVANPPSAGFTIQNLGMVPLVLSFVSVQRIGAEASRLAELDDRAIFLMRSVGANGVLSPIEYGVEIVIAPGGQQNFAALFNPLIPAVATRNDLVASTQVIPPDVKSLLIIAQNGGAPLMLNMTGHVATAVNLIHPDDPRRQPLVTITRNGDEFDVICATYDPNLDLYEIIYQFLDADGRSVSTPVRVNVEDTIKQGNYIPGQSLSFSQKFSGANQFSNVTQARVTLLDREAMVSASSRPIGELAAKVASVNAASFSGTRLASEVITAAFGDNLATATQIATTVPLPTTLGGARVLVRDASGIERLAPIFFAAPSQINYQIPAGTANGAAAVTVMKNGVNIASGVSIISSVAPGLFSINATGQGLAAGFALRARADGSQTFEPLARFDAARNQFVAVPIDISSPNEQVFLILFGTGIKGRQSLATVSAKVEGIDAEVMYAGPQGDFVGLDQINLKLSQGLAGKGDVEIALIVEGKQANVLRCNIK
jgi:uncharacterized protein (TIGR03437 family)